MFGQLIFLELKDLNLLVFFAELLLDVVDMFFQLLVFEFELVGIVEKFFYIHFFMIFVIISSNDYKKFGEMGNIGLIFHNLPIKNSITEKLLYLRSGSGQEPCCLCLDLKCIM